MRSAAELYDWELEHLHHRIDQDVGFYRGLALALGGPVLELACGTGRVAARLVARGVDVVGLDLSHDMLRIARSRGVRRVVQADMRRFAFASDCRFALVTIPYNSLQLLPDDDSAVACLRAAAEVLAPHGLIAFEATDFPAAGDVEEELLAEDDAIRLYGALRVEHDRLHYARRFVDVGSGEEFADTLTLRRAGASSAEAWCEAAGLTLVSADWHGLGLRVTARRPPEG